MGDIKIENSKNVQIIEGNGNVQNIDQLSNNRSHASSKKRKYQKQTKPVSDHYSSELESEICNIFSSRYQKERKKGISEANSKTLEFLKYKLYDLAAKGGEISWLDIGCGDGRCLDVLEDIDNSEIIRYRGIDCSYKYLDDAERLAKEYLQNPVFERMDAAAMKFDSEYDLVSAVLVLHEIDPLCLPYALGNMLRALKHDGTLVISDFEGPYEQEKYVVAWSARDIKELLESIGGARMSIDFVPSGEYPAELGFYRCYVKKPELGMKKFDKFLEEYGNFLEIKKKESKQKREELRRQIETRVHEILKRPDVDTKNISREEIKMVLKNMGDEYGIKAHRIRLLTNQIEFLDDKVKEFNSGGRCAGAGDSL